VDQQVGSGQLVRKVAETIGSISVRPVKAFFSDSRATINTRIRQLSVIDWFATYEIACYLYVVHSEGLWREAKYCELQKGYTGFYLWAYGELAIGERRARYLRDLASKLHQIDAPAELIKTLFLLGWTRACQICRVVSDSESMVKWCEIAKYMTESEVTQTVRLATATSPQKTLDGENCGELVVGKLKQVIKVQVAFDSAEDFSLFKKAQGKAVKRNGGSGMSTGHSVGVLSAHYLSSTFSGEGLEVASELEHKIVEFIQSVKYEYGIDLSVAVVKDDNPRIVS